MLITAPALNGKDRSLTEDADRAALPTPAINKDAVRSGGEAEIHTNEPSDVAVARLDHQSHRTRPACQTSQRRSIRMASYQLANTASSSQDVSATSLPSPLSSDDPDQSAALPVSFRLSETGTLATQTPLSTLAAPPKYTLLTSSSVAMSSSTPTPTPSPMLSTTTTQGPPPSTQQGTIIGAVLGSILGVLFLLLMFCCCLRRRRRHQRRSSSEKENHMAHHIPPALSSPVPHNTRRNASSWPSRLSSAVVSVDPESTRLSTTWSSSQHLAAPSSTASQRSRTFSSLFRPAAAAASALTPRTPDRPFASYFMPTQRTPSGVSPTKRNSVALPVIQIHSPERAHMDEASPEMTKSPKSPASDWPLRASTRLSRTFVGKWQDPERPSAVPMLQFPAPRLGPRS